MNEEELRELARWVADLMINQKFTEEHILALFKRKPELAERWVEIRERIGDKIKEKVRFT